MLGPRGRTLAVAVVVAPAARAMEGGAFVGPRRAWQPGGGPQAPGRRGRWRQHWRAAALLLAAGTAGAVLWSTGALDLQQLRDRVEAAGSAAPVLFVTVYAALTLLPVPKNVLSAAAGALFGFGAGLALVWVAAMIGALVAFAVARAVDPSALGWATGRHRERVEQVLDRHGVSAVVVVRLIPIAPFTAVNYVSGMSPLRVGAYVWGTGIGIIPGTVVYVAAGAFALGSPGRLGAMAAALAALVLVGGVWARRLRTGHASEPGAGASPVTTGRPADPGGEQ